MRSLFHQLSVQHLSALALALRENRLTPPFSRAAVEHHVPLALSGALTQELQQRIDTGLTPDHLAFSLELLRDEKYTQQHRDDRLELVWTGPEVTGSTSRDTFVVVRELLRSAKESVLIASYSLDQPANMQDLFGELASKMDEDESLSVRMFLNVGRNYRDKTPESVLLRKFAERFREKLWPGERFPEVFYDPRALEMDGDKRACLHAKCVIVDDQSFLVTSANFSEAAQIRNIEAGVLIDDARRAVALRRQFDSLVEYRTLIHVPGIGQ